MGTARSMCFLGSLLIISACIAPDDNDVLMSDTENDSTVQVQFKNVHSHKCIGVNGASTSSGALLQQFPCDGQANQTWLLSDANNTIQNLKSHKCIGVASTATETNVAQFSCNAVNPNQSWSLGIFPDGSFSLLKTAKICIGVDHASTLDTAQLKLFPCDSSTNQRWDFD